MAKQQQHQFEKLLDLINKTFPDLHVKAENLKCPSKDFVFEFYTSICLEFGMNIDFVMKDQDYQDNCTPPELLRDILPMGKLARVLERIFQQLHAEIRFGLNDLLYPTQSRTSVFVAVLINFFIFADERMSVVLDVTKEIHERKATWDGLMNEFERFQRLKNEDALSRSKAKDLHSEIQKNKSELVDLEKEIKSIENILELRQTAVETVSKKIARLQEEKLKEAEAIKMLQQQIVQSPDVLIHNHKHLKDKLPEVEAMVTQALQSRASKTQTMKHVEVMIKKEEVCQVLSNEVIAESKVLESLNQQLVTLQATHKRLSGNMDELQTENQKLKKNCSDLQEELTNVQLKWKKNKASLLENLRHLKHERDTLVSEKKETCHELIKEMERCQSEIDDISDKISALNKKYEEMFAALLKNEEELLEKKLAQYPADIFNGD